MRAFSGWVLILLLSSSVYSQLEGNPGHWCREGFFASDSQTYKVAAVIGSDRAYFFSDQREDCPGGPGCATKAYVVSGDQLVVSRSYGKFSCAWYTPKKGYSTIGWVESGKLKALSLNNAPAISAWLGQWKYGDNQVTFTENKLRGFLNVAGEASWIGRGEGNVNVGELDGRFQPIKGVLNYADGDGEHDCKASMRLLGNFLIVSDNLKCGGLNVTFSGVYKLSKRY